MAPRRLGSAGDAEFNEQLSAMPIEYLQCRVWRHTFKIDGRARENRRRGEIAVGLECTNCGIQADRIIDSRNGHRIRTRILGYPEGYVFKGTGRLDADQRGVINLLVVHEMDMYVDEDE